MTSPRTNRGYEVVRAGDGRFAFDIRSGRLFAVQNVLADVLEANPDSAEDLQHLASLHGPDAVRRAYREVDQVRRAGLLPRAPSRDESLTIPSKSCYCQATVALTDRCNLRCKYCYDGYQGLRAGGGATMDWLTLRRALDYVFRVFGAGSEIFDIHFFGGEPLLQFAVIRQAAEYCRDVASQHHVEVNLSISTNGLLLTPEIIEFFRAYNMDISVSLDGPPEAHDRARQFPSGAGSYELLEPKLDEILACDDLYVELAGVLSPLNTDVCNSIRWCYKKGGKAISFTIPKLRCGHTMGIKDRSLALIKQSYAELADYLLARCAQGDFGLLASLVGANDYFGRFVKRVFSREHMTHRCRAGKDMLAIGADGRVYPCLGFIGMADWTMGTISTLPNEEMRDVFCSQHVDAKASCRHCWGRYLCGGGCYAHGAMSNGRMDQPDPYDCELTQHVMRLAIILVGRLQRDYPEILPEFFGTLVRNVPAKHRKFIPPLLRQYMTSEPEGQAVAGATADSL
ncbi:MAG: SPASM domain-containing protein [Armatimonadota bacterium]|nr:MAG: SPASM domain-containing protein [Armatimonadota bacterium]